MVSKTWMRFNKYLYRYWRLEALVLALGLLAAALALINPYLAKIVIDKAYGARDLRLFLVLAAIGTAIFILSGAMSSVSGYLSKKINRNVQLDLTRDLFKHLESLPLTFFDNNSTGGHIYRVSQDADAVSNYICNTIPQIITLLPRLIFMLGVVFFLNWKLAALTAMLIPIAYIQPYIFGRWLREAAGKTAQRGQSFFRELHEILTHIRLVKAFGKSEEALGKFENALSDRMKYELENAKLSNISAFVSSLLNKVLSGIIALYGGYQVIRGEMTLGSLTAIMIYLAQLIAISKSIGTLYETTVINSVNRHRIAEIFDIVPVTADKEGAGEYIIGRGEIEFKRVDFSYKKKTRVLSGLSFFIPAGTKAALVGLSGSGKSTILSLILRLYEQESGAILIDGVDTRSIKHVSLKSSVSLALQEPYLWNDTIANNILYGSCRPATYDDMVRAARLSEAHDFIMRLPNGYDSNIGEMACRISEGQKERIAMARALIKRPKILVMDEALASIDSQTEDRILSNILSWLRDSTIVMASHRLSSVRRMEKVYFLEEGSRIKTGIHGELLSHEPAYRNIFASQLAGAPEDKIVLV